MISDLILMVSVRSLFVSFSTAFALLLSGALNADDSAPFGLTWGMTAEDLKSLRIILIPYRETDNSALYKSYSLPKNLSDARHYLLVFDKRTGLQKVVMTSENINDDAYGSIGQERFEALKETLSLKYGFPSDGMESVGNQVYEEEDQFYECVMHLGCGLWMAIWRHEGGTYVLQLEGLGRGLGYILFTAEGAGFVAESKQNRQIERSSDADAPPY